ILTLLRLSLNVASTRLILSRGAAGQVIQSFGDFVVGGNYVIGVIVFIILVVINFMVITKGSGRISEVAARFNLDAMPGKQMAIDADLNAGLIGEKEARKRREKIAMESEFHGSMDGASKFIRGDAIAGLIITAVNLIGGFVMGMTQGMTAGESVRAYAILAIGDGLVSQIPAVIIATSAGFLVSKTNTKRDISTELTRQFLARSKPMTTASFIMGAMMFVPGFPKLPFAVLALGTGLLGRSLRKQEQSRKLAKEARETTQDDAPAEEQPIEELLDVDRVSIQVGARLIKIVDPRRKGSLAQRISPLRRKFAQQYGVVLPLVRLRDNVQLDNNAYEIRVNGHVVAGGEIEPDHLLAMDPGIVTNPLEGMPAVEPVFNLPALWIDAEQKEQAELNGYTVVDPETVMVTHLSETLRQHAEELLSRDDVQALVDRLKERQPVLVNGVIGESIPMGLLHRVLQNLLRDSIPIIDLAKIIEALGDHANRTQDPDLLTELVRKALARTITEQHAEADGTIYAVALDPGIEHDLCNRFASKSDREEAALSPDRAMQLTSRVAEGWKQAIEQGHENVVLLCDYRVRAHLAGLLERQIPQLPVLAYDEVANGTDVQAVARVTLDAEPSEAIAAEAGTPQPA
ncbi:MAG: FHIPEP family type III secretion protein, partial [Phycisphaerae bacterium]|nr:FHIPEP family type III secretion protein [Phycisphaerae bacterium]